MTLSEWLDAEPGRTSKTAIRFGVTMSAVTQWRTNGVPLNKMREMQAYTRGKVTLAAMLEERAASAASPSANDPAPQPE